MAQKASSQSPDDTRKQRSRKHGESIMERFDKLVNAHLREHRKISHLGYANLMKANEMKDIKLTHKLRSHVLSKTLENCMRSADATSQLLNESDNELTEAIDGLIHAEDMSKFREKFIAAEAAVAAVPPELAEEAALAVTQQYQQFDDKITKIRETVQGDTIIEVVGYIGVRTRKDSSQENEAHQKDAALCSCFN